MTILFHLKNFYEKQMCTIHIKNLQNLMLEVYECINKDNPSFMWNMFHDKSSQCDLRSKNLLVSPQTHH